MKYMKIKKEDIKANFKVKVNPKLFARCNDCKKLLSSEPHYCEI
mgnify:CR=1 FL=1